MKALITGGGGQLATAMLRNAEEHHEVSLHSIDSLDITSSGEVDQVLGQVRPDVIINAAAYTAVDQAESDEIKAEEVNGEGPGILARAAAEHKSRLIHVSTDFVFDGNSERPWMTKDLQ